jgi:hypothetical protein
MKIMKRLSVFILIGLLAGCVLHQPDRYKEIVWDIYVNYRYYDDVEDGWQTPDETRAEGVGDCKDLALLFLDEVYIQYGVKGYFIALGVFGDPPYHAQAYINGIYYDATGGFTSTEPLYPVMGKYTYQHAMKKAEEL